jgi:hypothetical protein
MIFFSMCPQAASQKLNVTIATPSYRELHQQERIICINIPTNVFLITGSSFQPDKDYSASLDPLKLPVTASGSSPNKKPEKN